MSSLARFATKSRQVAVRQTRSYATPVAPASTPGAALEGAAKPNEWVAKRDAVRAHAARMFYLEMGQRESTC